MRNQIRMGLLMVCAAFLFNSCEKTKDDNQVETENQIIYNSVNKEYVLIRNVSELQNSDDEISNHIDSILLGTINSDVISTGLKEINLIENLGMDIGFEIIDLNLYNPNGLPDSFDSLAARVIPLNVELLDNSTYGYADALDVNDTIQMNNNWTTQTCVLGSFLNIGNFQGYGEKFLGFRFINNDAYKYGWIKLYCSQHNDTLRIIDYAYNDIINSPIKAGQRD